MNTNKNMTHYINCAMEEAMKSDCRCKHGAVIVNNGKIISYGHNYERGYDDHGSTFPNNKITRHAEQDAILSCNDKILIRGADMYVVRVKINTVNNGRNQILKKELSNSEPCHTCKQVIINCMRRYGMRRVYYSSNNISEFT